MKYKYAVIQYFENPASFQPINIGVILHDLDTLDVHSKLISPQSLQSILNRDSYAIMKDVLDSLESNLSDYEQEEDYLDNISNVAGHSLKIMDVSLGIGENSESELELLYKNYVVFDTKPEKKIKSTIGKQIVKKKFNKWLKKNQIAEKLKSSFSIPEIENTKFDFGPAISDELGLKDAPKPLIDVVSFLLPPDELYNHVGEPIARALTISKKSELKTKYETFLVYETSDNHNGEKTGAKETLLDVSRDVFNHVYYRSNGTYLKTGDPSTDLKSILMKMLT